MSDAARTSFGWPGISRKYRLTAIQSTLLAAIFASGCSVTGPDHVEVGAIPDDYRTNHPIVISEREEIMDIPVGPADSHLSAAQKVAVTGFLADYDQTSGPTVQVLMPHGGPNQHAVTVLSPHIFELMVRAGVPRHKIIAVPYGVAAADISAPIRLSYVTMTASTGQCGRWPDDISKTAENKHYANFGCSYQNNLAAQIANPADLLGPRKPSEINAAKRGVAIGTYQETTAEWSPVTDF